ncbi:MAG: TonB-dependent receptor [Bacteroidales bacterium]
MPAGIVGILLCLGCNFSLSATPITEVIFKDSISAMDTINHLNQSVVSAGLYIQRLNELPQSVNVIPTYKIRQKMSSNLIDVVSQTPGFTQVWEYHSPIILRGMNSNRIIIMKDACRRIGTFPGGYFGQDMNVYDSRKIEIVKGPASVIYGSGAISGIINIISEKPFGNTGVSGLVMSAYGSNNNEFLELSRMSYKSENFGISVNGKYRKTGNMVYGNGEIADNSDVEDKDFAINAGYKINPNKEILFNASYHYGNWGKPRGFNGPKKYFTCIRNEEESLHGDITYSYKNISPFLKSINFNAYIDHGTRDYKQAKYNEVIKNKLSSETIVHYKDFYTGARLFGIVNLSPRNDKYYSNIMTIGTDAYIFRLDNPSDDYNYYYNTATHFLGNKGTGQATIGAFINDDWRINEKIKLSAGLRFDFAEVREGHLRNSVNKNERTENRSALSGNIGTVYFLQENTIFTLNIGRAFRMPVAEELFTYVVTCKGIKKGNPDLKPEYSWNIDLGLKGDMFNHNFSYDISGFYDRVDDYIVEDASLYDDVDFTLRNADASLIGGEANLSYLFNNVFSPANTFKLGAGASYVYGVDISSDLKNAPMFGIPPFMLILKVQYDGLLNSKLIQTYHVRIGSKIQAAQNRVAAIPEGTSGGPWGYHESDANYTLNANIGISSNIIHSSVLKLNLQIKNILNTDYKPFGSYIPAMGRNIKLALVWIF